MVNECKNVVQQFQDHLANKPGNYCKYVTNRVTEWKNKGVEDAKIQTILTKNMNDSIKCSKTFMKNCTIENWRKLPTLCMKIFAFNDYWLTRRIEEMAWAPFNQEISESLGLWLGMIQAVVFRGVKEIPDDNKNVSLS